MLYLGHCLGPSLTLRYSPWFAKNRSRFHGYSNSTFQPQMSTAISHVLLGYRLCSCSSCASHSRSVKLSDISTLTDEETESLSQQFYAKPQNRKNRFVPKTCSFFSIFWGR